MGEASKPVVDLNLPAQQPESTTKTGVTDTGSGEVSGVKEMPSISTLLQRKKHTFGKKAEPVPPLPSGLNGSKPVIPTPETHEGPTFDFQVQLIEATPAETVAEPTKKATQSTSKTPVMAPVKRKTTHHTASLNAIRGKGEPPVFRRNVVVEACDLKAFEKNLKKHRDKRSMLKLDCLGFFSARFSEISYFSTTENAEVHGVLGWGNEKLVTAVRGQEVLLGFTERVLSSGETITFPFSALSESDQKILLEIGYTTQETIGAFPVFYGKKIVGFWICAASTPQEVTPKEIKTLKKLLTDLEL